MDMYVLFVFSVVVDFDVIFGKLPIVYRYFWLNRDFGHIMILICPFEKSNVHR